MGSATSGGRPHARWRWWTGAALAGVVLVGACGTDEGDPTAAPATTDVPAEPAELPQPVQTLAIDGVEYAFEMDDEAAATLRPGWTEVRFDNVGSEAHQVMFARLKDGVDMAELAEAGAGDSSGAGAIEFVDMIGGVSYIDPGNEATALVDLPVGVVIAMCYVPTPAGEAHALLGMQSLFTVGADPGGSTAAPTSEAPAPAPGEGDREVRGTIELAGDGYRIPDDPEPGWYHVVNTDTDDPASGLHELSLLRLDESLDDGALAALVEDLANNVVPDVGLDAVGGLGAISAGFDGYLWLDLSAGDYLAVDFMPDPGEPRPHMLDGYWAGFTVGP